MAIELNGIVTWLSGWFPLKGTETRDLSTIVSAINTALNGKVNLSQGSESNKNMVTNGSGNIVTQDIDSLPTQNSNNMVKSGGVYSALSDKIDTAGGGLSKSGTTLGHNTINAPPSGYNSKLVKIKYDNYGHITDASDVTTEDLTNEGIYANIGSNLTNQKLFNQAVNTKIGQLSNLEFIVITDSKGTAEESKMNKLYVVSESGEINYYYVKRTGTSPNYTYEWENIDANIVVDTTWDNVKNKPSSFTPASHNHGIINNDGTVTTSVSGYLSSSQIGGILAINSTNNQIKYTNLSTLASAVDAPPKSHASSATTYGVGTTGNYGHNKVINDLTHSSFSNGESLSAYQGYVLNQAINNISDDIITSIVLVPDTTDATGKIIFYQGDEPSNNS